MNHVDVTPVLVVLLSSPRSLDHDSSRFRTFVSSSRWSILPVQHLIHIEGKAQPVSVGSHFCVDAGRI